MYTIIDSLNFYYPLSIQTRKTAAPMISHKNDCSKQIVLFSPAVRLPWSMAASPSVKPGASLQRPRKLRKSFLILRTEPVCFRTVDIKDTDQPAGLIMQRNHNLRIAGAVTGNMPRKLMDVFDALNLLRPLLQIQLPIQAQPGHKPVNPGKHRAIYAGTHHERREPGAVSNSRGAGQHDIDFRAGARKSRRQERVDYTEQDECADRPEKPVLIRAGAKCDGCVNFHNQRDQRQNQKNHTPRNTCRILRKPLRKIRHRFHHLVPLLRANTSGQKHHHRKRQEPCGAADHNPDRGADDFARDMLADRRRQSKHQIAFPPEQIFIKPQQNRKHGQDDGREHQNNICCRQ